MKNALRFNLQVSMITGLSALCFLSTANAQVVENSFEIEGTTFSYGASDQNSSLTVQDARGILTHLDYDDFGRMIQEVSAERGSIQYKYDENSNIVEQRSEGGLIFKRQYDDQNRLIREVMEEKGIDRKVIRYTYDDCDSGAGRVCSVNSNGNITRYDYNRDGKHTRISTRYAGEESFETTRYFYNDSGALKRMRYPTGLLVRYHYGENGLINRITGRYETGADKETFLIAKDIQINPETGSLLNLKFGNGLRLSKTYDDNLSLVGSELLDGNTRINSFAYTRNEFGRITKVDRLNDEKDTSYTYDDSQRLVTESTGGDTKTQRIINYTYDAVNNRTLREEGVGSRSYAYAATSNQLSEIGRQGLKYDVRGNLLEDKRGKRRFKYDATNRLVAFYKNGELKANYEYNSNGQRIRKIVHGTSDEKSYKTLSFAYAPNGELLSEFGRVNDKTQKFARDYVWFGNVPIAQIERQVSANGATRKAKISFIHVDHLKAPTAASDQEGKIVWEWNRDAYGQGQANRDVDGDGENTVIRLRFPGQYFDRESKLFYNHFRDYDPKLGRYIQSDPIGLRGGINRYAYVEGDPVNATDPKGLSATVSISSTNCYVIDYYQPNGQLSHSSPARCEYEVDVQYNGPSAGSPGFGNFNSGGGTQVAGLLTGSHTYDIPPVRTSCSADQLLEAWRQGPNSAPTDEYAQEGTRTVILLGNNPITQTVDVANRTILNRTQASHMFHSGTVLIRVNPVAGGGSQSTVTGRGDGAVPWFNDMMGIFLFRSAQYRASTECADL